MFGYSYNFSYFFCIIRLGIENMKKKKLKIKYVYVDNEETRANLNRAFNILFEAMEANGDLKRKDD